MFSPHKQSIRTLRLCWRWPVAVLAVALVAAGLAPTAPSRAAPAAPASPLPVGEWTTFANGDDVIAMAIEGETLWAGTRVGGLVRWDTVEGSYAQFSARSSPWRQHGARHVAIGADGRKWLATDGGLSVLTTRDTAADGRCLHTYTVANSGGGCLRRCPGGGDAGPRVWVG
jgi:hypothetical protein